MTKTPDLLREFEEKGFLHLKALISTAACDQLIARMRDLVARFAHQDHNKIFDTGPHTHSKDRYFLDSAQKISFFFDKNSSPKHAQNNTFKALNKVGHALHDLCPVYRRFSHQEKFYELMKTLGHRKPQLVQSMFIFKQPFFGDAVPAHQDATFLHTDPPSVIGLWIALEDAHEENGCLWVLPHAHKSVLKERFVKAGNNLIFKDQKKTNWPADKFIPLRAQKGDIIVLHGLLPHSSKQNRSSKTRFAYTLHFVDRLSYYLPDNWLSICR